MRKKLVIKDNFFGIKQQQFKKDAPTGFAFVKDGTKLKITGGFVYLGCGFHGQNEVFLGKQDQKKLLEWLGGK